VVSARQEEKEKGRCRMKKLLVVLVLACVAPAMAANVTVSSPADGQILLTADAGIVGVGLTVDGGSIDAVAVDSFFDVFIDSAFTAGAGYEIGDGIPTALQSGPGELALPSSSFSISVGGLDDDGIEAGTEEAPLTATFTLTPTAGTTSVTIDEDTLRGGIVGYDGAMVITGLPLVVNFGAAEECIKTGTALYTKWEAAGKPLCWCYAKNCKGDADGFAQFSGAVAVYTDDLAIFVGAFGKPTASLPANGQCANFDRAAQFSGAVPVYTDDLNIFIGAFGKPSVTDCDMTDYNFWVTP